MTLEDPFTTDHRTRMVELAPLHRLPALHGRGLRGRRGGVRRGVMSYGPDPIEQDRRAAVRVDRVLNGARPAELPVEQPTRFELVINVRTANALGLRLPPSLVLRADHQIE